MTRTAFFCTAILITIACYDLVAILIGGIDNSISRWAQDTAFGSPLITFVAGFICGHLFGYMKPVIKDADGHPYKDKYRHDTETDSIKDQGN